MAAQASPATAATTVSGSFAFLNYNVAGLPVVHEPPTTLSMEVAANAIGSRLGPYDIVQMLTSWIAANVPAGDALIVAGDTNSRYTRTADDLQSFIANNGLIDAWVRLELGGVAPAAGAADLVCNEAAITNTCEVTNKFLYRSSKWVTLNATAYDNEHAKFLDSSWLMLSDMDPILTGVSWTENPSYQASDDFGGTGGTAFNDITSIPARPTSSACSTPRCPDPRDACLPR